METHLHLMCEIQLTLYCGHFVVVVNSVASLKLQVTEKVSFLLQSTHVAVCPRTLLSYLQSHASDKRQDCKEVERARDNSSYMAHIPSKYFFSLQLIMSASLIMYCEDLTFGV